MQLFNGMLVSFLYGLDQRPYIAIYMICGLWLDVKPFAVSCCCIMSVFGACENINFTACNMTSSAPS